MRATLFVGACVIAGLLAVILPWQFITGVGVTLLLLQLWTRFGGPQHADEGHLTVAPPPPPPPLRLEDDPLRQAYEQAMLDVEIERLGSWAKRADELYTDHLLSSGEESTDDT